MTYNSYICLVQVEQKSRAAIDRLNKLIVENYDIEKNEVDDSESILKEIEEGMEIEVNEDEELDNDLDIMVLDEDEL